MALQDVKPASTDEGFHPEALSNEVLKLKVDDLFQEIEILKRRVGLLEDQQGKGLPSGEVQRMASESCQAGPLRGS